MNSAQPDISVITVNYNGYHDTCEFIDSWVNTVTSVCYEIIVVDNGSTANEGLLLQQKYPSVHVIRSEQNLGFAGGNNLGIRSAQGNYLFLLNNDTLIVKDTVDLLIKRLRSSEDIAGVSPLILNYTEPHTIQFAGYTPYPPSPSETARQAEEAGTKAAIRQKEHPICMVLPCFSKSRL